MNEVFGSADDSTDAVKQVLAGNLRRLRIARGLSLSELARATSVGKATLSAIETGQANPTVGTLSLLAAALRVPIGELLDRPPLGEVRVVRAGPEADDAPGLARRALERIGDVAGLRVEELSLAPRHLEELPAGDPGSREELYVLQGRLVAGPVERITELTPGDWASFPADVPRQLDAGRHRVRLLLLRHAAS